MLSGEALQYVHRQSVFLRGTEHPRWNGSTHLWVTERMLPSDSGEGNAKAPAKGCDVWMGRHLSAWHRAARVGDKIKIVMALH